MKKGQKHDTQSSVSIELTREQYWDLLRAAYIADWVANAICERGMKEDKGMKKVRNYIFSFAEGMGFGDYVKYDDEFKDFYATWDMDDEPSTRALIERYDDSSFWPELVERLTERDFFRKYTKAEVQKMDRDTYVDNLWGCEEVWGEEFEKHGIERLEIKDSKSDSA